MPAVQKTIVVNAPIEQVFQALDDPDKMPLYVPNVRKVSDVHRSDARLGDRFQATYMVLGLHFEETFTYTEYERPRKITAQFADGMTGTMSCTLEPLDESTRLTLENSYQMPGGVLGKARDALLLERMNEKTAERMLENIKMIVESQGAAAPH
jgi:uncharacterized protein YndB with AHSA1/START domain